MATKTLSKTKYMYYRCSDRIKSFPLSRTCLEKGIDARIVDDLVWKKVAELMVSPNLLQKQITRWETSRQNPSSNSFDNREVIEKRFEKLKSEEERYNKSYGAGLFSMEQLKEYTSSIRDQLAAVQSQLVQIGQKEKDVSITALPDEKEVRRFALEAKGVIKGLKFEVKQGIVRNVIEKIIGSVQELKVYGYISINSNVEFKSIHRNRRSAKRWEIHAF